MKAKILTLVLLIASMQGYAQPTNIPDIIPPSPNAASLGIYGQIPVSLFSGLPQISIPLGNVKAGDISVPITLNYHGGGVHPDIHSSWTGLGWDLNAGGVITRRVNNFPDEIFSEAYADTNLFSYYYHYSNADNANWASTDTMLSYLVVNPENPVNTYYITYPAPDEFVFNFGKYSGSFFYTTKGKWQVRSADPVNITVQEQLTTYFPIPNQPHGQTGAENELRRIFYQFTLTTPDGTKYVFGGTPTSIEFTRTAPYQDGTYNTIVPTSWFLTSVTSRSGQQINLSYQTDSIQATVTSSISRYQYTLSGQSAQQASATDNVSASIINPSYLTQITAPNQTVNFAKSASNELPYNYSGALTAALTYSDLSKNGTASSDITDVIMWRKLDSISFYSDSTGFLRKFVFNYVQNPVKRLILDSLTEMGSAGFSIPPYVFIYDTTSLPIYNAQMLDHWGFYNGHNFFADSPRTYPSLYEPADVPYYYAYRNSNPVYMKAGNLTAIKYPTGGSTLFTWEPNDFYEVASRYPFGVYDTTGNVQCGGERIRMITNTDASGNTLNSKQYYYVRNYSTGGAVSSGILGGVPQYFDQATITASASSWLTGTTTLNYWFWYDVSVDPLSFTNGNHVTYSEVTEKLSDSSYTVNTFSNYDVGTYNDQSAVSGVYPAYYQWKLDPNNSLALDRGKLLTKSDYSTSGTLLRKIKYDYDTASTRENEAVKMMNLTPLSFGVAHTGRATSYLQYTFPQYLLKETDTLFDQNGANPLVTVQNMRYDTTYRLKMTDSTISSAGNILRTVYTYPVDMLGQPDSAIYRLMTDSNMISPVVVQTKYYGTTQTNYTKTSYYSPYTGVFVPQTVNVQEMANPVETRLNFSGYDNKGNILSVSKNNDFVNSYLWGYHQTLPIAEVKNAVQSDIAYAGFESDSMGNWIYNQANIIRAASPTAMPPTGIKYYQLTPSNTLVKSGLNTSRTYVLSYWTTGSAISVTGTIGGYPITGKTINGWTYYEHKITGQSTVTLSATALIDEVRLYPAGAQMNTYTYDPALGMTSHCDVDNRVTYYTYDGLGRLQYIKDQDGNIIKTIQYHFKGQ